VKLVAIS